MNYWKKMAFVLALVAGLCGGAWAQQDWEHHDKDRAPGYGEANNDYQRGYRDGLTIGRNDRREGRKYQPAQYKAYKNGDEAYKRGFGVGYNEGFGGGGR